MYSHGSSARAGVGKRGHGGRNYRPPPERRDATTTPPPLKQCSCLLEFAVEEYSRPVVPTVGGGEGGRRSHRALGGAQAVQNLESFLRSNFCVHLIVPGRKQAGPVGIVGASYRETLPAAAHLLQHLEMNYQDDDTNINVNDTTPPRQNCVVWEGRVFVNNARDPNPTGIVGRWTTSSSLIMNERSLKIQPYWLFQSSSSWSVLVCPLQLEASTTDSSEPGNNDKEVNDASLPSATALATIALLKTCLDNAVFRLGSSTLSNLDFFVHGTDSGFCVGHPDQCRALFNEVSEALHKQETNG